MGAEEQTGLAPASRPTGMRLLLPLALLVALLLAAPFLALGTPPGQRLVERLIEAPLLARLEAAAPAPFQLQVETLTTKVGGATLNVTLQGAQLTAPGVSLALEDVRVRVRYMDVLRQNLVPERIEIAAAHISIDDLAPVQELGRFESAFTNPNRQAEPLLTIDDFSALDLAEESGSQVAAATPDMLASLRLDGLVNAFDRFDQALANLTLGTTWQGLESITVEEVSFAQRPNAAIPFLRAPEFFSLAITRQSPREMVARLESLASAQRPVRDQPLSLIVRHAEGGAPQGPAILAEVAGEAIGGDQAFSHILLRGLRTDDLTDALQGDVPVAFASNLAAEIVVTREADNNAIAQIVMLFESDAGYLIAGGREATILEFASIPMVYTRQNGRFDIVDARLQFQETGGVFNGALEPTIRDGRRGLSLMLQAPSYRLAVPAEPVLGRSLQRAVGAVDLEMFIDDEGDLVDMPLFTIGMGEARVALSGSMEMNRPGGPLFSLVGQSTPMRAPHVAAMWPLPLSPQARNWFLRSIAEGRVGEASFTFAGRLNDIEVRDGRTFLRDDMLRLSVPYENLVMRTLGDLPAVYGLDGQMEVTGRTLHMSGQGGVGRLDNGDQIQVSRADFSIPDHALEDPDAALTLDMHGPASGFLHMAGLDPILLDDVPFAPGEVSGDVQMTARIEAVLADEIDREAVRTSVQASLSGFASTAAVEGRALTDGRFAMAFEDSVLTIDGQARLDGVLTDLAFSTNDEAGVQMAMRLDADGRRRLGLDFGDYLTGTIGVDVGALDESGQRAMRIDLTEAALAIPELGWSKPSGRAASARFDMRERGDQRLIRNLEIDTAGLDVAGSLDFNGSALRTADLDRVSIDGVGSFALTLTRNGSNTSARLTGERLVLTPDLLRGNREAAGALTLDMQIAELTTQDGAQLNNVALRYAQDGQRISSFDLRASHSDGTDLAGTLAQRGGSDNLVISSGNAGTFLRFLGLYDRASGGRATLVLDPSSVGGRVAGQLLLSDYFIVDEPAMERIFSTGRDQAERASDIVVPGEYETVDRVSIEVTNISFDRTPERLIIHKAEGWGPSLGGNIEGTINYANNSIAMNGTYVPFFSINNLFSRIPIFGQLLGGGDSEGLLGVTFALVGRADAPELRVNPMSILAPGVIRNIFEYQQSSGG